MSEATGPIGEDDLHAFVDDQLGAARLREVETYLDANPDARRRIDSFRADRAALCNEASARLSSPVPLRLRMSEVRRVRRAALLGRARRLAAGLALFALGLGLGSMFPLGGPPARAPMDDALAAYRVFAKDPDHAVEIGGAERVTLVNRITGHLGRPIAIPDLSELGLAFLGGRLLASDEGPGGMFLYAEPGGGRIAVYVKTLADGRRSAFRSRRDGDVVAHYWFDGRLGYAVVGQAGSPIVSATAEAVRSAYR